MDTDSDLYYQDNLRLFKSKSRAAMTSAQKQSPCSFLKPVRWKLLVTCVKMLYFFYLSGSFTERDLLIMRSLLASFSKCGRAANIILKFDRVWTTKSIAHKPILLLIIEIPLISVHNKSCWHGIIRNAIGTSRLYQSSS